MQKKNTSFLIPFLLFTICTFTFSSCLTVNRQIRINKDGSGQETMRITFLKDFYAMMASLSSMMDSARHESFLDSLYNDQVFIDKTKKSYDTIPGIKILEIFSTKNPDSSNTFVIKYDFDSIRKIGQSMGQLSDTSDKSKTSVELVKEGSDYKFQYLYEQLPGQMPQSDSSMAEMKKEMSQLFGNGSIKFEIEFPYEIISSNASSSNGSILIWDYTMPEIFMTSRMKLEATMKDF